jgi:hypothetical protein
MQVVHRLSRIRRMATLAGFKLEGCFDMYSPKAGAQISDTLLFAFRKPGAKGQQPASP